MVRLQTLVKNMETKDIDLKTVKKLVRKEIKQLRASYTDEEIHEMSLNATELFVNLPEYQDAQIIYAYMDCKHEVETREMIRTAWKDGKKVAVPKVQGERMQFYYIQSFETDLEEGYFGIQEPRELYPANETKALLLMPGVAFDEARHRVGYGGGFYDRFLEEHPEMVTVALAFEFQVKAEVPYEEFDICPAKIVTEKRVIA